MKCFLPKITKIIIHVSCLWGSSSSNFAQFYTSFFKTCRVGLPEGTTIVQCFEKKRAESVARISRVHGHVFVVVSCSSLVDGKTFLKKYL